MARQRGLPADLVAWARTRDDIYRQIMEKGWNEERGAFVQHYGSDVLDAANLLMPLVKFVSPKDPRWLSTLDLMTEELGSDTLVYRSRASPDLGRGRHLLDLLLASRRPARGGGSTRRVSPSEDADPRQPPGPVLGRSAHDGSKSGFRRRSPTWR
jgi:hypothetical protein